MIPTRLQFRPLERTHAEAVLSWRYPPPYEMYNSSAVDRERQVAELLQSELNYMAVLDQDESLIAFRCFGPDARVPDGVYPEDALDLGGGLRPDLTGRGLGRHVIAAAMVHAIQRFQPRHFRTTVASFNVRALKTCHRLGYQTVRSFVRNSDGLPFDIMVMNAKRPSLVIPLVEINKA